METTSHNVNLSENITWADIDLSLKENLSIIVKKILSLSEKSRETGLLCIEDDIDINAVKKYDILELGLLLIVHGTDNDEVNKILSNLELHETDPFKRLLNTIKKTGVLEIQCGNNTRLIALIIDSLIPEEYRLDGIDQYLKHMENCEGLPKVLTFNDSEIPIEEVHFLDYPDKKAEL